jgi:hypothetical protein
LGHVGRMTEDNIKDGNPCSKVQPEDLKCAGKMTFWKT